ncbi:MAG: hypothetical protein Kow00122_21100 [Thermoleophilia bacterium]
MNDWLTITSSEHGLLVGFRVNPAARVTRVQGAYGDRVKVQVSAPAEDNRANEELRRVLAEWLDMDPDYVAVHAGHKKRDKVVAFRGVEESVLRQRLSRLVEESGR